MMFDYFCRRPDKLPTEYLPTAEWEGIPRAVCDYISGMTDGYAVEVYHSIFVPRSWGG